MKTLHRTKMALLSAFTLKRVAFLTWQAASFAVIIFLLLPSCAPSTVVMSPETAFEVRVRDKIDKDNGVNGGLVGALIDARLRGEIPLVGNDGKERIEGIDVLQDEPNRPFTELAFLQTTAPGNASIGELMKNMVAKARSMGADAIIITKYVDYEAKRTDVVPQYSDPRTPKFSMPRYSVTPTFLRGIAIRYENKDQNNIKQ